ncbi:MAG: hypothetical protein FWD59_02340 [Micrococcales bacterium]|nr:hypothetical protein [Micrococcales bacterium]
MSASASPDAPAALATQAESEVLDAATTDLVGEQGDEAAGQAAALADLGEASLRVENLARPDALSDPPAVGDRLGYVVTIENTGGLAVSHTSVVSDLGGISEFAATWPDVDQPGVLLPGEIAVVTGDYRITQDDLDAGTVVSTVLVEGKRPDGTGLSPVEATSRTGLKGRQLLVAALSADVSGLTASARAGQTITYRVKAVNTGSLSLRNVALSAESAGMSTPEFGAWPQGRAPGELGPGESVTASATYALRQADIDTGRLVAGVRVSAQGPAGSSGPTPTALGEALVQIGAKPALSFAMSGSVTGLSDPPQAGQTINYSMAGSNTGNVTLRGIVFEGTLAGATALTYTWPDPARPGVAAPGQQVRAVASYRLSQSDIDRGRISNRGSGRALAPLGTGVSSGAGVLIESVLPHKGLLTMGVVADAGAVGPIAMAGDVVTYLLEVRNATNTTARSVTLHSSTSGLSEAKWTWPGAAGILAPGQEASAVATYRLTEADLDARRVVTTLSVSARDAGGVLLEGTMTSVETAVDPGAGGIVLGVMSDPHKVKHVGDRVTYVMTVTNHGRSAVEGLTFQVSVFTGSGPLRAPICGTRTLDPGMSTDCTTTYVATAKDMAARKILATVTALAKPRAGVDDLLSPQATVSVGAPGTTEPVITASNPVTLVPAEAEILASVQASSHSATPLVVSAPESAVTSTARPLASGASGRLAETGAGQASNTLTLAAVLFGLGLAGVRRRWCAVEGESNRVLLSLHEKENDHRDRPRGRSLDVSESLT